ncbi:GDP-6-deoxy-D-mannose reductase [Grimontia celer]|uniref:GDP-6-deoxy-D-mannose reductase n=1 Tax=Grimontia celer TaxID=1796497 RepID=A0A128F175_9GAMM|nr:NAD-dependent epimerase/dehydratase family protein [Grimontia celer]CZF80164.1 GDP-6-deoxy-D-mannose reductase [Grimontia celer]
MKVLITGHTGFIGTHLKGFFDQNAISYSLSTDRYPVCKDNLDDICTVLHLAGMAHNKASTKNDFYEVNASYPFELAQRAKNKGVKKFIYLSSVNVYAQIDNFPISESNHVSPDTDYSKSKLLAEQHLNTLVSEEFQVIVLRCPLVYGKGAPANFARLMDLTKKLPITPFGCATSKRSYISAGNLCSAILSCVNSKVPISGLYNVTDACDLSTQKLVQLMKQSISKKYVDVPIPVSLIHRLAGMFGVSRLADTLYRPFMIDSSRFQRDFKWHPMETPEQAMYKLWSDQ